MRQRLPALLLLSLLLSSVLVAARAWADTCTTTPWSGMSGVPPLTDFPPGYLYLGKYAGFLYSGSNQVPSDHDADGRIFAANVKPRDRSGAVCSTSSPGCKVVLLSIGFSNNTSSPQTTVTPRSSHACWRDRP